MNPARRVHLVAALLVLSVSLAAQTTPPLAAPAPGVVATAPIRAIPVITQSAAAASLTAPAGMIPVEPVVTTPPIDFPQPLPVGPLNVTTSVVLREIAGVYAPPPPPASVVVQPGTALNLSTPFADDTITGILWYKNGVALGVSTHRLALAPVTENDAGTYTASVQLVTGNLALFSGRVESLRVRVETPHPQRLLNLSSRTTITPSNPMLTSGFVVAPSAGQLTEFKTLLIRAVGPSLAKFGVSNPLAHPRIKIFDHAGVEIQQARAAIWLGYNENTIAVKVGAFAFLPGSSDVAQLLTIPAGLYTVQVTSGDGTPGDLLLEIYEVPDELLTL